MNITHVLLDIEGTTCPVSFVSEVLFPYASSSLEPYLEAHQGNAEIAKLMRDVEIAWREDYCSNRTPLRRSPCKL